METAIGAGDFKARCLKLIDDVAEQREPLIITKRGKPVTKLIPVATDHKLFGCLKGSVVEEGDIIAPVGVEWDAAK